MILEKLKIFGSLCFLGIMLGIVLKTAAFEVMKSLEE